MNTCQKDIEMVYNIHFAHSEDGYNFPDLEKMADCIIGDNQTDQEIIDHLIAADFLRQYNEYIVIDFGPSIHIHNAVNGKVGSVALILIYEGDLEQ